jgi:hypothetical protein
MNGNCSRTWRAMTLPRTTEPRRHVHDEFEHGVRREETFRQREATVRRIVERALQPLGRGRMRGVLRENDEEARQRADAFAAHGIALVSHRGGTDLFFAERFFQFVFVAQETQISRHLRRGLPDRGQRVQHASVLFAGVGLSAHADEIRPTEAAREVFFQRRDACGVAAESLRNESCVPVAPRNPRKRNVPIAKRNSSRSRTKS